MSTHKDVSKWLFLAATLLFAAATFQIADGHWIACAILFAAAVVFMSIATICRKREKVEELTTR